MNRLDRLIGWFSPETGRDRARARIQMQHLAKLSAREYDGAKIGRRTDKWLATSTSANTEIAAANVRLRNRARDLVRNNPYATRVVDTFAANVVGCGIQPVPKVPAELAKRVEALWRQWSEQCDAEGQLDFGGLQTLAVRSMVESGEVLQRFRPRFAGDGLVIPLQIQLLESDYLDVSRDAIKPTDAGSFVYQGIEFNGIGQRSGYWLYRVHPGDSRTVALPNITSDRVPAPDVLHLYRKLRPGQIRGVTWLAPIILKARDLDEYHEAALVKAKMEASFGAFVTQPDGEQGPGIGPQDTDADGERVEYLQPGVVQYLRPGESIEFANPSGSGAFDPYTIQTLMAMAVGAGVTYDQLTGDLRQANYSSLRAGKIEFRRLVEQVQYQAVIPMFCRPVWQRFIAEAIAARKIPDGDYPVEWVAPRNEPIDPKKDLEADIAAVRAGAMTWAQFVASWGNDPSRQLEEIAQQNKDLDAAGVVLDTDPRLRTSVGNAVTAGSPGAANGSP